LERKLVAGGSPTPPSKPSRHSQPDGKSSALLDKERDSVLKSLSQIVGEMTNQVRATNDRVAALESANETERTERNAWMHRAERAETRVGDLERALKSTREELLAVHDKTSAKVAKIATENAENAKNAKTTSPSHEDSNKQRVDALDREHRETRELIQRLEASHETLGRQVARFGTDESRTRDLAVETKDALTDHLKRFDSTLRRVEATRTSELDSFRLEITGTVAKAQDATLERAMQSAERALVETAKGLKRERLEEQESLTSALNQAVTQLDHQWSAKLAAVKSASDAARGDCEQLRETLERRRRDDGEGAERAAARVRRALERCAECEELCSVFLNTVSDAKKEVESLRESVIVSERIERSVADAAESSERSMRAAQEAAASLEEASSLAQSIGASQEELINQTNARIGDIERAVADTVDAVVEQLGSFKSTIEGRVELMDAKAEECRERAEFATRCADHASAVAAESAETADSARETAQAMGTGMAEATAVVQVYADAVSRAETAAIRCVGIVRDAIDDQNNFHRLFKTAVDDVSTVGYAARNAAQDAVESAADAGTLARVAVADALQEVRVDAKELTSLVRKEKRASAKATKLAKKDRELAKEALKRAEEKAKFIEGKSIATAEERTRRVESDAKAKIAEAKAERARLVAAAEDKVKRVEAEARSKEIASRKRLKDAEAKLEQLAFERNDLTRQIAASSGAMAKAMAAMAERSHQQNLTSSTSNVSSPSDKSPRQRSTMFNTSPRTRTSPRPPRSPSGVALPGMVEAARRLKEATSTSHSELNQSVGLNQSSSASLRLSSSASPSSATGKQSQSPDGAARLRSLSAALRTKSTEVEHIRSAVSNAVSGLMTSPAPKGLTSVEGSEASVAGESPGVNWGVSPVNAHAPTPTSNANHRPSPLTLPVETIDEDAHRVNADDGATGKQSELDLIDLNTPASESARRARESLEHARSIVKRLNSPPSTLGARGGHAHGSSSRPPPSPATRGAGMGAADPGVDAEVGGSEVARNFVRGGRGRAIDPSSPVARGLAMFDSPGRTNE
jgi:DNA repair exonuclease SbcCD ATPase subunit